MPPASLPPEALKAFPCMTSSSRKGASRFGVPDWPTGGQAVVNPVKQLPKLLDFKLHSHLNVSAPVEITHGTCSTNRAPLRAMTSSECEQHARAMGATFIGLSADMSEFAGCVLWSGKFLEYNKNPNGDVTCETVSKREAAKCLCLYAGIQ